MQIKTILLVPLLATGLASAAPSKPQPIEFEVLALRSASPIHFTSLSASESGFFLDLPHQNAKCAKKSDNTATLQLLPDGELQLYTASTGKKQRVFTDRSGMGQGVLQYTSGNAFPRYSERRGWKIDKYGDLNFKGAGLIACPYKKTWTVWVDAGVAEPGFNKGCLSFVARAVKTTKPNSCTYTEQK